MHLIKLLLASVFLLFSIFMFLLEEMHWGVFFLLLYLACNLWARLQNQELSYATHLLSFPSE